MLPTNFPRSPLEALSHVQPKPDGKPTPREVLNSSLYAAMQSVVANTGRAHVYSDGDLQRMASRLVDDAESSEPNPIRLTMAGALLDRKAWDLVNDHLRAKGHEPVPDHMIAACDPLQYALAMVHPKASLDEVLAAARTLRAQPRQANGTLNLRNLLGSRGGPQLVRELSPTCWHALIGDSTEVVLPLFPDSEAGLAAPVDSRNRNRNGRDAAAVINAIRSASPHVTSVNISGGHGPQETDVQDENGAMKTEWVQTVDLSLLGTGRPEVTIRIKEKGNTDKVVLLAPEGVVVHVVSDTSTAHTGAGMQNHHPINDIRLYRTTGNHGVEEYRFDARDPQRPQYVRIHPRPREQVQADAGTSMDAAPVHAGVKHHEGDAKDG